MPMAKLETCIARLYEISLVKMFHVNAYRINSNPGKVNEIQMAQFRQTSAAFETVEQNSANTEDIAKTAKSKDGGTRSSITTSPVSRYQTTLDERHRFQERVRLETIAAARFFKT